MSKKQRSLRASILHFLTKKIFFKPKYLHIPIFCSTFAAEFTPKPCYAADGGGFFTYWWRLLTLCIWRVESFEHFYTIKSQNQSNNRCLRVWLFMPVCLFLADGLSYRRRFHCCLFDLWGSSKALVRRWAIAKSALSLCMYAYARSLNFTNKTENAEKP